MSDIIAEWIEKLATGEKTRIFWAIIIAIIVALFILYPRKNNCPNESSAEK